MTLQIAVMIAMALSHDGVVAHAAGQSFAPKGKDDQKPRVGSAEVVLGGIVTSVRQDAITVSPGNSAETKIKFNDRGQVIAQAVNLSPPRPPITLKLSKTLSSGEYSMQAGIAGSYRIKDVKVGDQVVLSISHVNKEVTCTTICIQRRPGGKVPPAPGDSSRNPHPWHERCNALQDLELKGSPFPEKKHAKTDPDILVLPCQ